MNTERTSTTTKIQKEITELKNTVTKLKNTLDGFNCKLDEAEERTSDLEERTVELTQTKQQKQKRILKSEGSLRNLQGNIKWNNIHIIGVQERQEEKKGKENIFEETMAENFPNLEKKIDIQIQEVQRVPIPAN